MLIIFAKEDGIIIAGALHIIGKTTLFGRYWGLLKDVKFLHFELCYYQAIEWAISHKINFVEGGAQGFHKVQRGYLPVETHSSHYIRNDKFKKAVREFIVEESNIIEKDIDFIKKSYSPYKNRKCHIIMRRREVFSNNNMENKCSIFAMCKSSITNTLAAYHQIKNIHLVRVDSKTSYLLLPRR